ncbi:hypothetical protein [Streptomyces sp. WMMB303]|uniref:hypothetical protein n=1 Tax=Streptomyces sp. WMMB303 TaxID=3034154 RepID=UPI0023EB3EBC|nr:hypothetical protein [Streptomyces sp. WMMB303]MDF4251844.1 hypothetical protein [Streptomyces sp. WMMB303]MDF4254526.1 hypothetical protein [Streptomyces sp. WMMB303]
MRSPLLEKGRKVPNRRRIIAARLVQLLALGVVPIGIFLSSVSAALGAQLTWKRWVDGAGGSDVERLIEGTFGLVVTLFGLCALAVTLWAAGYGVRWLGARVAGTALAQMTDGLGGGGGGFFETVSSADRRVLPPGAVPRRSGPRDRRGSVSTRPRFVTLLLGVWTLCTLFVALFLTLVGMGAGVLVAGRASPLHSWYAPLAGLLGIVVTLGSLGGVLGALWLTRIAYCRGVRRLFGSDGTVITEPLPNSTSPGGTSQVDSRPRSTRRVVVAGFLRCWGVCTILVCLLISLSGCLIGAKFVWDGLLSSQGAERWTEALVGALFTAGSAGGLLATGWFCRTGLGRMIRHVAPGPLHADGAVCDSG